MQRRSASAIVLFVVGATLAATRDRVDARFPMRSKTVWDSVYSAPQAARGETAYVKSCARCHKESLAGADESPALAGSGFLGNWNGLTLAALHDRIRTSMPPDSAGTYARPMITNVIAYILNVNGFPAGAAELPTDSATLKEIVVQATKP